MGSQFSGFSTDEQVMGSHFSGPLHDEVTSERTLAVRPPSGLRLWLPMVFCGHPMTQSGLQYQSCLWPRPGGMVDTADPGVPR